MSMKGLKFDYIYGFQEGYAHVTLNGKWNHIDTECNLVSKKWWDWCWLFQKGLAKVELEGKGKNYIDTNGNLKGEWL